MVVIAIDRQQILLGSLARSYKLPSRAAIAGIWILATVLSIPHFIYNRVVPKQIHTCVNRCQAVYPSPSIVYIQTITMFTFLSQYIVPLIIIGKWKMID